MKFDRVLRLVDGSEKQVFWTGAHEAHLAHELNAEGAEIVRHLFMLYYALQHFPNLPHMQVILEAGLVLGEQVARVHV